MEQANTVTNPKLLKKNQKSKKLFGVSYSKNMANFETFRWTNSSSINLLFLKSENCIKWRSGIALSVYLSRRQFCIWSILVKQYFDWKVKVRQSFQKYRTLFLCFITKKFLHVLWHCGKLFFIKKKYCKNRPWLMSDIDNIAAAGGRVRIATKVIYV